MTAPDWPPAETFCFAVLPDTQIMAELDPAAYDGETRWLADRAEELRLRFVLHVGDVVNQGSDEPRQFEVAARAHARLLDAGVPMLVAPGNHDYDDQLAASRSLTVFDAHVGTTALAHHPWFGGAYDPDSSANAFALVDGPGGGVIVVSLEFGPRPDVIDWAAEVLAAHADRTAFVVTHCFLDVDGERASARSPYHPGTFVGSRDGMNGQQVWDRLIRRAPNVAAVFSGHQVPEPVSHRVDAGDAGQVILQAFQNWQMSPLETMARIRLVWWRPLTRELRVRVVDTRTGRFVHDLGYDIDVVLDESTVGTRFPIRDGGARW